MRSLRSWALLALAASVSCLPAAAADPAAPPDLGRWEAEFDGGEWFPTGPSAKDLNPGEAFSLSADYRVHALFSIGVRADYVPGLNLGGSTVHHTQGFFFGGYGPYHFTSNIYGSIESIGPYLKFRTRFGSAHPFELYSLLQAGVDRFAFNGGTLFLSGQAPNGGPPLSNVPVYQPPSSDVYVSNQFSLGANFALSPKLKLGAELGYHRIWEHDNDEFATAGLALTYAF